MRLKMADAHNVLVQLEGKDGAYNAERVAWYDGGDGWQVLVYEFAAGPDFDKITDSGNNVLAIWPFEKTAQGEGKTFYVDDIKLEGTMVWNGDWHPEAYDDYALLAAKLAPTATVLDVTDAARWDEDWTAIKAKCPNIEIRTTATAISLHPSDITRQPSDIKYHNLGGQRVVQPVNGLYIVNGKKVIKK